VLYCGLKTVADTSIDIPNRAAFKASEVCEIAQIPSYVLRSWEKEFPGLGAASRPGGPRIYRRADVEQILRIKELVFAEGLTLAGARRKLEGEPPAEEMPDLPSPTAWEEAKARVADARRGLRDVLTLLSTPVGASHHEAAPRPVAPPSDRVEPGPTWPPAKTPEPTPPSHERGKETQTALPLLETSPEPGRKPRPTRRGATTPRGSTPTKVE
jgi:DNA-binding transcriptional MerR regulator